MLLPMPMNFSGRAIFRHVISRRIIFHHITASLFAVVLAVLVLSQGRLFAQTESASVSVQGTVILITQCVR